MSGIDVEFLQDMAKKLEAMNKNKNYKYYYDIRDAVAILDEIISKHQDDEWRGED